MRTSGVEVQAAAAVATVALERLSRIRFDSPEGEDFRAAMMWEQPSQEEARVLLQWVEALANDLRVIAE